MSFTSKLYNTYSHRKVISLVSYIVTPNFLYIYISYVLYMCISYTCHEIILHMLTGDIDCSRGLVYIIVLQLDLAGCVVQFLLCVSSLYYDPDNSILRVVRLIYWLIDCEFYRSRDWCAFSLPWTRICRSHLWKEGKLDTCLLIFFSWKSCKNYYNYN